MTAHNYHRILVTIDQALDVFAESAGHLSADDYQLKQQIEVIRSKILKAESGIPFPLRESSTFAQPTQADLEVTRAPWST